MVASMAAVGFGSSGVLVDDSVGVIVSVKGELGVWVGVDVWDVIIIGAVVGV